MVKTNLNIKHQQLYYVCVHLVIKNSYVCILTIVSITVLNDDSLTNACIIILKDIQVNLVSKCTYRYEYEIVEIKTQF